LPHFPFYAANRPTLQLSIEKSAVGAKKAC